MDKQQNISEFDKLFKQTFEGASNPVPPGIWEGVSSATSGAGSAAGSSVLSKIVGMKGAAIIGSVAVVVTSAVLVVNSLTDTNIEEISSDTPAINTIETPTVDDGDEAQNDQVSIAEYNDNRQEGELTEVTKTGNVIPSPKDGMDNPSSTTPVAPVTDGEGDNGQSKNDVDMVPLSGEILSMSGTICVHQKVDFVFRSKQAFKTIQWKLNGNHISSTNQFVSFLFDAAGDQVVSLVATTENGRQLSVKKTVTVGSASADFKVSQRNGIFDIAALKPLKENQWFANQVLIKENQSSIQFEPIVEKTTIVHMVTDLNGCRDTARQTIVRQPDCDVDLRIYDVITPYYMDGVNDDFIIELPAVEKYRLTIYNFKDGKVVFDSEDQNEKWNGRFENTGALVPGGNYLYNLIYVCNGKSSTKQGKVTVLESKN